MESRMIDHREQEANHFAMTLIMPENVFRTKFYEVFGHELDPFDDDGFDKKIKKLARIFKTSRTMIIFRIARLHLFDPPKELKW